MKLDIRYRKKLAILRVFLDETFRKDKKLSAFLTIRDDESPIIPQFYSFGAGADDVGVGDDGTTATGSEGTMETL